MVIFDRIAYLNGINKLIQQEATGTPDEFAERIHLGRKQMYNILNLLTDYGAVIRYSRKARTFYYANDFNMEITVKFLADGKEKVIF
jgi:predicted transcriptional regulator